MNHRKAEWGADALQELRVRVLDVRALCLAGVVLFSACGFVSLERAPPDAGSDAAADAFADGAVDAATDVLLDVPLDVPLDAPLDVPLDAVDAPDVGPAACPLNRVRTIAASFTHTCALDGRDLYCWGDNSCGQTTGDSAVQLLPRLVPGEWVSVDASEDFTCARTPSGELHCWGCNESGQLGVGDEVQRRAPVRVALPECTTSFSVGFRHACAIDNANVLRCWGDNEERQLAPEDGSPGKAAVDNSARAIQSCAASLFRS